MSLTEAMVPERRRAVKKYGCEHMKQLRITKGRKSYERRKEIRSGDV